MKIIFEIFFIIKNHSIDNKTTIIFYKIYFIVKNDFYLNISVFLSL